MKTPLSAAEAEQFKLILASVAERSCRDTAVILREDTGEPEVYYRDGLIWTHWFARYPIEEAKGWVAWAVKTRKWEPYLPRVPLVVQADHDVIDV